MKANPHGVVRVGNMRGDPCGEIADKGEIGLFFLQIGSEIAMLASRLESVVCELLQEASVNWQPLTCVLDSEPPTVGSWRAADGCSGDWNPRARPKPNSGMEQVCLRQVNLSNNLRNKFGF